jgi:S-adenosylmethionine hydrolase
MGEEIGLSELAALHDLDPVRGSGGSWLGEVVHVDRFGNLVTNLRSTQASDRQNIEIAGEQIRGLSRTYADARLGEVLAYVGSSGYLEIAVREGNAATRLGADVGEPVRVQ